ncbi:sugar transferase [Cohnella terricola]|uniref:Sugar transferase n=1 Tax=Cohnella terricola TaxID=1289167 RepID=A0A559JB42_9BACL|nr:sugar transferase [Cohnella terricola]TVX97083.1 sugar transferase [Cohnella terricola]
MNSNERITLNTYPNTTFHVGSIAEQRIKVSKLPVLVDRSIFWAKFVGYVLTFYLLISLRVIPDFQGISQYNPIDWAQISIFTDYVLFLVILLVLQFFMHLQNKLFSSRQENSFTEEFLFEFRMIITSFMITLGITFLLKTTFLYSRLTLMLFLLAMIVESVCWIAARRTIMSQLYQKGSINNNVLIVGAGKVGLDVYDKIVKTNVREMRFLGYLDDYKTNTNIIGKISDLEKLLQQQRVDTLYITIPSEKHIVQSMLRTVYKYDIDIRIIPEMFDRMSTVFSFRSDLEYPCLQVVKTPLRGVNVLIKRFFDICGSFCLLAMLSPFFLIVGIVIKLESRGPVFFKQKRIGKNGLPFNMIKFRSMKQNAEAEKEKLSDRNEMSGPVFKLRNDPRVTRVGGILRRYSIDELPQLWNVLRGQMSLIGPRPPLPDEVAKYTDYHWRRMDVLPGMTGLWQVSGRSDLDFEQWLDLDIYYIEHWSFMLEMKILFKTIPVVIKGAGAY